MSSDDHPEESEEYEDIEVYTDVDVWRCWECERVFVGANSFRETREDLEGEINDFIELNQDASFLRKMPSDFRWLITGS